MCWIILEMYRSNTILLFKISLLVYNGDTVQHNTVCICRYSCGHVHVAFGYVQCECQQLQLVHVVCWSIERTDTSSCVTRLH